MCSKFRLIEIALKPQFLVGNLNFTPTHKDKIPKLYTTCHEKIDFHRGGEINRLKFERGN